MAAARTVTTTSFIVQLNYELRNIQQKQWVAAETLVYVNKMYELIYMILVDANSELIASGSGTITTVAGTEAYDLSANAMGDLWSPYKINNEDNTYAIYLTDASGNIYEPIEMVPREDRYPYVVSGSSARSRPTGFYLDVDNIGLLPVPDAVYTVTIDKYFPNWTPLADGDDMPLKNLFNLQIKDGVKLIAKNREGYNMAVEAAMLEVFQDRALQIMRQRRVPNHQMSVG